MRQRTSLYLITEGNNMSERYKKLYLFETNTYSKSSPVIIKAGALQKDNDKNNIIALLKIVSISNREILAVKVRIDGVDSFGGKLESQEAQYLDLEVHRNQEFGQQIPIVLKDDNARSFTATVLEVVFADKSKWVNENEQAAQTLNVETLLDYFKDEGLVEQYGIENGGNCQVVPTGFDDLWVCTCGSFNDNSETECNSCGKSKSQIEATIDTNSLKEKRAEYIKKKNYSQAQELMASDSLSEVDKAKKTFASLGEYENAPELIAECDKRISDIKEQNKAKEEAEIAKSKRLKRIRIAICSIMGMVILISGALYFVSPTHKYNKAQSFLKNGDYDKAAQTFTELGDYKDSKTRLSEVKMQQGIQMLEAHQFTDAQNTFLSISDYKNAKDYLTVSKAAEWYDTTYVPNKSEDKRAEEYEEQLSDQYDKRVPRPTDSYEAVLDWSRNKKLEIDHLIMTEVVLVPVSSNVGK